MRKLHLVPLVLALCLAACGGGGGGAVPAGPPPPDDGTPPPPQDELRTKEMLQDCLPGALTEAVTWADRMQAAFDGNGSAEGLAILPGGIEVIQDPEESALTIRWSYSPDGGPAKGGGTFSFLDDLGAPVQPFSQADLDLLTTSEDIDTLGTILPRIAEGTVLVSDFIAPDGLLRSALLSVTFTGGAPAATDGAVSIEDVDCSVSLSWSGVPMTALLADLATTFPSGGFDLAISAGTDSLVGTLTLDGTRTATASVSRNGGASTTWQLDLVTGVATQQ